MLLLYLVYFLLNALGIAGGLLLISLQQHPLAMTIGAGTVSSFIVSILIGVYYLLQQRLQKKESEEAQLFQKKESGEADIAREYGLLGYLPYRPFWKVSDKDSPFLHATYIDILEVSAHTICQQNEEQDLKRLQAQKIRVLLLDPRYPSKASFAAHRDKEEGRTDTGEIHSEVCEFLRKFGAGGREETLEVRLTTSMPTMSYFRWDNTICWAPLLFRLDGHSVLHTRLTVNSPLGVALARNYDRLWSSGTAPEGDLCTRNGYCKRHQPVVRSSAPRASDEAS